MAQLNKWITVKLSAEQRKTVHRLAKAQQIKFHENIGRILGKGLWVEQSPG